MELPRSELQDDALRTKLRSDDRRAKAPQWIGVEDEVMEERMSEDEQDEKVMEWLERSIQPQDSVSVRDQVVETDHGEPMLHANHGASDQPARERMWKHS